MCLTSLDYGATLLLISTNPSYGLILNVVSDSSLHNNNNNNNI